MERAESGTEPTIGPPVCKREKGGRTWVAQMVDLDRTLVIFDFDGVMTDNTVTVNGDGIEAVTCHRGDGWGIARLREKDIPMMVLSTETNNVVEARCNKLRIPCHQGVGDKISYLKHYLNIHVLL